MEFATVKESQAVWLYGSEARGDALQSSDVDMLVIGTGMIPGELIRRFDKRRVSISRYGWNEMNGMVNYGSLFLHHLKAEAKVLYESPGATGRLRAILDRLPPYQRAQRDVRAFRQSLLDISAELPKPPNLEFELATLAALMRRIGILGSYLLGCPRFDRIGPVGEVVKAWKLPRVIASEFKELYKYRLLADGAGSVSIPPVEVLAIWIERADTMLDGLEAYIDE